ncbi:MAG TPA: SUF system NifU family Fe-S cluster assembly protein [Thermoanaerobaculia bacterium]|nr:SUF system NifU family Fe-S cluster assembly protein [Thermoanaerobaculia bacterium]
MIDELRDLYQEIILDHNKKPRNFRRPERANREAEGYNPLCGDQYTLWLEVDGDTIVDFGFEGAGCAISKASASVMGTLVKGKTADEARRAYETFRGLVTGEQKPEPEALGKLAAFAGVSEFPARVKCAILPWHTMISALDQKQQSVSTE